MPEIIDASGHTFNFGNSPIPPWAHLYMSPPELLALLLRHTDRRTAEEMVYYVYHAPHLNRLFLEDYIGYFSQCGMRLEACEGIGTCEIDPERQAFLERMCPAHRGFRHNGMLAILEKNAG